MGMMDKLNDMKEKAKHLAGEHGGKVREGMEKAGKYADEKTGGKYSDKIDKGVRKGKHSFDKLADDKETGKETGAETGKETGKGPEQ